MSRYDFQLQRKMERSADRRAAEPRRRRSSRDRNCLPVNRNEILGILQSRPKYYRSRRAAAFHVSTIQLGSTESTTRLSRESGAAHWAGHSKRGRNLRNGPPWSKTTGHFNWWEHPRRLL